MSVESLKNESKETAPELPDLAAIARKAGVSLYTMRVANDIYDGKQWDHFPILADSLVDDGWARAEGGDDVLHLFRSDPLCPINLLFLGFIRHPEGIVAKTIMDALEKNPELGDITLREIEKKTGKRIKVEFVK